MTDEIRSRVEEMASEFGILPSEMKLTHVDLLLTVAFTHKGKPRTFQCGMGDEFQESLRWCFQQCTPEDDAEGDTEAPDSTQDDTE